MFLRRVLTKISRSISYQATYILKFYQLSIVLSRVFVVISQLLVKIIPLNPPDTIDP